MSRWKTLPLGDFAESVDYGITASAAERPIGPKFLRITDIQNGGVNWESVPWCECDTRSASDSRLKAGDIVFARTGATTGKSFLIRECPADSVFASYLIRVRVGDSAEPRFVSHFFQTPNYWAQITKSARGVAQPGVNATTLKALKIPLPPLAEQRRIAEVLDQAETLRAKRRVALAQLDSLTQSIFLDLFGDPASPTQQYPKQPLETLLKQPLQNGAYYQKEFYTDLGGVEMVHMSDAFYEIVARGNLKRVICSESDVKKYALSGDDVLIARRSLTLEGAAKPCLVPKSIDPLIFESSFIRVTPHPKKMTALYLYHYLRNERVKQRCVQPYITQSTISGINQSNLERVPVIVPPLPLQQDFARRVGAVEKLRTAQRASLAGFDALFATLQHRAFRGEL